MKSLVLTVGLPRSGKSCWARSQPYPIVNPDSIRLAIHGQVFLAQAEPLVWAIAKVMVRSLFLAGHEVVVLDATNVTRKRREEWQSSEWSTYHKVVDTGVEECLRRARAEGREDLIAIIERMASQWEPLGPEEQALNDGASLLALLEINS